MGKRVGKALYLHRDALGAAPAGTCEAVERAISAAGVTNGAFNVVKLEGNPPKRVTLLAYESFDRRPFPSLLEGWTVDLEHRRTTHRSYRASANPPILHRKELLLATDDPRREAFGALTAELECQGLFANPRAIGHRRAWEERLAKAGVTVTEQGIVVSNPRGSENVTAGSSVERYRTAISRDSLSRPLQCVARHGYLNGQYSIFDYGCGRGDDVRLLKAQGIDASGWDPYYAPGSSRMQADVVNLGYVVNVIDDAEERRRVVEEAWQLTRVCLVVGVMLRSQAGSDSTPDASEGVLTKRNTYQKYYSQAEIRDWIAEVLGESVVPVGPGVMIVHRDKLAEQRFFLVRHRRPVGEVLFSPRDAQATPEKAQAFHAAHRKVLETLWREAVTRGRTPVGEEIDRELVQGAEQLFRSVDRAIAWLAWYHGDEALKAGAARRREDLLVLLALEVFSKRRRYRDWPAEVQNDMRAFWGSHARATEAARELLFSLGSVETILEACQSANSAGVGHMHQQHSLQLHVSLIRRLPAPLRAYIGCAEHLYGDVEAADLVKIHIHSGKLTLLFYNNFTKRVPMLRHRAKILLRKQDIEFFDYGTDEYPLQPLWLKSLYMTSDMADFEFQRRFDEGLLRLRTFDFSGFGPSLEEFVSGLHGRGLYFDGNTLSACGT